MESKEGLIQDAKVADRLIVEIADEEEGCIATLIRAISHIIAYILLVLVPCYWCSYIKVIDQYERCVHFRLGKLQRPAKGPGMFVFLPNIDTWKTVDLRSKIIDVPPQEMMTRDSVTVQVNAVVYYHIRDAIKSVLTVQNPQWSTGLLAQTTLRAVVGECELDELLQKREHVNEKMTRILDNATDHWGIKVTSVEISDVALPQNMQRAMGSQAEAERDRRAKVISAEGELQASRALLAAAQQMTRNPTTMQLRYLQTLVSVSQERNNTYVFPLPVELLQLVDNLNKVLSKSVEAGLGRGEQPKRAVGSNMV